MDYILAKIIQNPQILLDETSYQLSQYEYTVDK